MLMGVGRRSSLLCDLPLIPCMGTLRYHHDEALTATVEVYGEENIWKAKSLEEVSRR